MKPDIHQTITDSIVRAIENGAEDFAMPWTRLSSGLPFNVASRNPYRGANVIQLWVHAASRGYASPTWGTYKQWQDKGAQVRKGERSVSIVFYKTVEKRHAADEEASSYMLAKGYCVFNAEQVDGYADPVVVKSADATLAIAAVDAFVAGTQATIKHGGDRAYYRPSTDEIQMPPRDQFCGSATSDATQAYYSTLLHELTHWTGHETRCDRQFGGRFGNDAYAVEELVAELGAAFLCAELGITLEPRADHAAYIASWLRVLKGDKRAIFTAASKATAAATFLRDLQPQPVQQAA